jgi:DNA helicase-2/ATP-dependent DNA helicase PcrA
MVVANEQRTSIWKCMESNVFPQDFNMGTVNKFRDFMVMIKSFQTLQAKMNAFELAKHITNTIGLIKVLKEDDSPEGVSRVENVEELLNAIMEFSDRQVDETTGETARVDLVQFMEDVALLTDSEMKKDDGDNDYVSLMTIHSAKGLEFPYVYVVGMEENLFPGILSLSTREELEEERRLFYVAITRAMTKLTLSYAEQRYRYGNLTLSERSRFVDEIDANLIEQTQKASFRGTTSTSGRPFGRFSEHGFRKIENTPTARPEQTSQPAVPQNFEPSNPDLLQEGMRVMHQKFGAGTILSIEGAGANKKASVNFDAGGVKMLMLKFARLAIIK